MKLLVEIANEQEIQVLSENTNSGKKRYIVGKWAAINEMVKNGRIYPEESFSPALKKYKENFIEQKRALGELNHPANPNINLDKVSHMIEDLNIDTVDGKRGVFGKARILESTPMGAIAAALLDEGVKLGVSTRGLGSIVNKNGQKYVHSDFMLNAIDLVSDPSGPNCFVNNIMESIDYEMLADGTIIQLAVDATKKKINEKVALKEFQRLMNSLKG